MRGRLQAASSPGQASALRAPSRVLRSQPQLGRDHPDDPPHRLRGCCFRWSRCRGAVGRHGRRGVEPGGLADRAAGHRGRLPRPRAAHPAGPSCTSVPLPPTRRIAPPCPRTSWWTLWSARLMVAVAVEGGAAADVVIRADQGGGLDRPYSVRAVRHPRTPRWSGFSVPDHDVVKLNSLVMAFIGT